MCFSQRHELDILKLPYFYTRIKEIIKYIVNDGSQVSYSLGRKLQIRKGEDPIVLD